MKEPDRFYLAFSKQMVEEYRLSKVRNSVIVRFTLVPTDTPDILNIWNLACITAGGDPAESVAASPYELLSLRLAGVEMGREDLGVEGMLIQRLRERATARGAVLPAIAPTRRMPYWSKMAVPGDLLWELRRAVGG